MRTKQRGQALVELALILGLLVILVIGGLQMLQAFYVVRNVRAAAEDAVTLASIHGGDTAAFREQIGDILSTYRLDAEIADIQVNPPQGSYLRPLTVRIEYAATIHVYGLFDIDIPPQQARALSQKDWEW